MGLLSKKDTRLILDPLADDNPITIQVLGICSALAITAQLKPSIVMAVSVIFVLGLGNVVISLMRNIIPSKIRIIVQLIVVATLVIIVDQVLKAFAYELSKELSVFIGLIISNLAMIVINRSWVRSAPEMLSVPNSALWWVLGCAVLFLGLILYVPFLREQFSFSVIKSSDLLIAVLAGALCTLWFEIWKLHSRNTS